MEPPISFETTDLLLAQASWARRLACALAGDEAADDLLQDSWLAALRRPPDPTRSPRPWLGEVIRNLVINRAVARRRRRAREEGAAMLAADHVSSPEWTLEALEGQRLLVTALETLEEPFRQTLLLRYFHELSAAEIARRSNVPAGTVRWRVKVGIERLRARLDEAHGGRAHWRALLLPLAQGPASAGPVGARRPRSLLELSLVVALLIGGAASVGRVASRGRPPETATSAASALDAPPPLAVRDEQPPGLARAEVARLPPPAFGGALQGAAADDRERLVACKARLGASRRELLAHQQRRRRVPNPLRLFALGRPLERPTNALAAVVARELERVGGAVPEHHVECRTGSCRLAIILPKGRSLADYVGGKWSDPELESWITGAGAATRAPIIDAVTGDAFYEYTMYGTLADPLGARVPDGADATSLPPPAPETADACEEDDATLAALLAEGERGVGTETASVDAGPPLAGRADPRDFLAELARELEAEAITTCGGAAAAAPPLTQVDLELTAVQGTTTDDSRLVVHVPAKDAFAACLRVALRAGLMRRRGALGTPSGEAVFEWQVARPATSNSETGSTLR